MMNKHIQFGSYMAKLAADPSAFSNMPQLALQEGMPTGAKRKLDRDEQREVAKGKSRWLPEIFQSYATKPQDMMASPLKQSLLYGLLGAGAGGLAGGAIGHSTSQGDTTKALLGALIGAGVGAGGAGVVGGLARGAKNRTIEDLMQRSPKGSTKRDLLADPIYRQDTYLPYQQYRGGGDYGMGMATGMMMNRG